MALCAATLGLYVPVIFNSTFILSIIRRIFLVPAQLNYYYFDYNELTETVDRIELIRYNNSDAKEYLTFKKERLLSFDFEKMELREKYFLKKRNSEAKNFFTTVLF